MISPIQTSREEERILPSRTLDIYVVLLSNLKPPTMVTFSQIYLQVCRYHGNHI